MGIGLLTFLTAFSFLGGILLRYIPFAELVTPKQKKLLLGIYAAALIVDGALVYHMCREGAFTIAWAKLNMIVFGILSVLANILVIRGKAAEHLFTYGLTALYNYMLLAAASFAVNKMAGVIKINTYMAELSCFCVLFMLCYPLGRILLRRTVTPFLTLECDDYWHTIWFVPVSMYYACVLAAPADQQFITPTQLIGQLCICIATVFLCRSIAGDHKRLNEKLALDAQLSDQRAHYAELSGKVLEARRMKHDFKHHIAAVYHYIETDDKTGLKDYCDQLVSQQEEGISIPYTGNVAADGVFYRYIQMAKANGVHFKMSGVIKNNGIADVDLCVLLGNALDNAMNGCMTIQENRYIRVAAEATGQMLSLMVQNSFDGIVKETEEGRFLSRRRNNKAGIGLESIRQVCRKYDGSMEMQYDETTFTVCILCRFDAFHVAFREK